MTQCDAAAHGAEGLSLNARSVLRQEKVAYVWNEPRPRVQVPDRLTFRAVRPADKDLFLDTIEAVLHGSLDTFDRVKLPRSTARDVAKSYAGCAKAGLEEGTLHFIGVLPEHRGNGYFDDLLCAGTRVLQNAGVWRIDCDTDAKNVPMIKGFRRVGYEREESRIVAFGLEIE